MPRDEIGIEKELDTETKTLLLKYGPAFESTVNAAYACERVTEGPELPLVCFHSHCYEVWDAERALVFDENGGGSR